MASSQVATTTAGLQQQCLTSCDQVQSRNPSVSAVCLFRDGSIGADGGPAEWFLKSYIGT
jgi:hypothetical protein